MKSVRLFAYSLILMLFIISSLFAANGKLAGVVKDNTGKPVPGATVTLEGTKLGGFADVEGRYFVLNIPPGKYDIIVRAVGYAQKTFRSVEIKSDLTTDLNVVLEETAVEVEGITIEAERKLVDKTLTSTRTTIGSDELSNTLPISSTYELLQTTPAVFKGFIRGGKQDQTKTLVDGVDISDEYYGMAADQTIENSNLTYNSVVRGKESQQALSLNVNPNTVSELTVNTGAVSAEYASASAGIINYSLKEGKGALSGRAYFRMSGQKLDYVGPRIYWDADAYFAERDALKVLADGGNKDATIKYPKYTWTEDKYEEGQTSIEGDLSLTGGLSEDLGFYFSLNLKDNPNSRLPNEQYRELNTQLKLTYNIAPELKLNVLGMLNDKGLLFGWKNRYFDDYFKFFLEGVPQGDATSWVGSAKLSHFLSSSTFYEIQISNKYDRRRRGFCDDNGDGIIQFDENGDFLTWGGDTALIYSKYLGGLYNSNNDERFFAASPRNEGINQTSGMRGYDNSLYGLRRPGIFYSDLTTNVLNIRGDFTSQINFNHQLKAGLNFKSSNFDNIQRSSYVSNINASRGFVSEEWNITPIEFSAYAQDRMEYAGLVINLGFRVDMWDPAAAEIADYYNPFVIGTVTNDVGQTFKERLSVRGDNIAPKWFFSPRLAVSHPISDKAAIYFSFSNIIQPPPASMLYSSYNDFNNPSLPNILVVNREPYRTTNYELGVQWEVLSGLAFNLNGYMRDIMNYNNVGASMVNSPISYNLNFASGYANARGLEFQLETLPYDIAEIVKLSGRVSYTWSYIKKSQIVSGFRDNPMSFNPNNGDKEKYDGVPYEDFQYYRKFEINATGGGSTLTGGYDREHRISYTLFARFPFDISLTSIGYFQSGFYWVKALSGDPRMTGRELETGPWNKMVDLRLEKAFMLSVKHRIAVFLDVKNLFDTENILGYDNSNSGGNTWETKGDPVGTNKRPLGKDGSLFYDIPREIYFGITIDF